MRIILAGLAVCCGRSDARKLMVVYVTNWSDPTVFTQSHDLAKITHIDIAFENPVDETGALSLNPNDAALLAKAHASHLKVLISIGGGGASEDKTMQDRYFDLQTDAKRPGFVRKLVSFVTEHDFDGLDVDLEGAAIGKDYGAFISDLSAALIPNGKLLTAAVSEGNGGDRIPSDVLNKFSFVNLMAYDATGPWDPKRPGPHASMDMAKSCIQYWLGRGLPKSKTVLGVPFYGYGFGPAYKKSDYPYSEIVSKFPGSENKDQVADAIYYNGIPTMKAKAKYIVEEGLAGIMVWSFGADAPGPKSLLSALDETLRHKS